MVEGSVVYRPTLASSTNFNACFVASQIQEEERTENITVGGPLWTFEPRPAMDEVPTPRSPTSTEEK